MSTVERGFLASSTRHVVRSTPPTEALRHTDAVTPQELRTRVADMEGLVWKTLRNSNWPVPPSSQSSELTAASFQEVDGTQWTVNCTGLPYVINGRAESILAGTRIALEQTENNGRTTKVILIAPLPDTPQAQLSPEITYIPPEEENALPPSSPTEVNSAEKIVGKFGSLNGSVTRVENKVTFSGQRVVFSK